jgi:uncharacterized protein YjbI with pentapeptide repeats
MELKDRDDGVPSAIPGGEAPDYLPTDPGGDENSAETIDYAMRDDLEDEPENGMAILEDYAESVEFNELIAQLQTSTAPDTASDAANMLRERGWLLDGTMKGMFLQGADLRGVDFSDALLMDADMDEVDLSFASLAEADLEGASLREANFEGADLTGCNFENADLTNANFKRANMEAANLKGAEVTMEQLKQAERLEDAILPDGTQYDKE